MAVIDNLITKKLTAAITLAIATVAAGQSFSFACDHDSRRFGDGYNL